MPLPTVAVKGETTAVATILAGMQPKQEQRGPHRRRLRDTDRLGARTQLADYNPRAEDLLHPPGAKPAAHTGREPREVSARIGALPVRTHESMPAIRMDPQGTRPPGSNPSAADFPTGQSMCDSGGSVG